MATEEMRIDWDWNPLYFSPPFTVEYEYGGNFSIIVRGSPKMPNGYRWIVCEAVNVTKDKEERERIGQTLVDLCEIRYGNEENK
jgi:hypothetical protein